jgi:hypothetical protein
MALGNIQTAVGSPNASATATPQQPPNPMMSTMGNIGPAVQGTQQAQPQTSFAQRAAQLHPQAVQALKNLPPGVLQHLHNSGMIHPQLMQHLNGSTH